MDSSAPTILRSCVKIPCTPSTFFPFIVKFCTIGIWHYVEKKTKINKRGHAWTILKKTRSLGHGCVALYSYNANSNPAEVSPLFSKGRYVKVCSIGRYVKV